MGLCEQKTKKYFMQRGFSQLELDLQKDQEILLPLPVIWVPHDQLRNVKSHMANTSFYILVEPSVVLRSENRIRADFEYGVKFTLTPTSSKYLGESSVKRGLVKKDSLFTHPDISLLYGF